VPECQKIKNGGLEQYGPEHYELYPFDTTRLERVNQADKSLTAAHTDLLMNHDRTQRALSV